MALASLIGCQGFSSNSTSQPQSGTLSFAASNLNFGSVAAGNTKTLTLNATNSGSTTVTVSSAVISTQFFSLTAPSLPTSVSAGQSVPISVQFSPNAAGNFTANVTVASDASNSVTSFSVSGTGTSAAPGELTPNPASEAFGNVTVGTQEPLTDSITNTGGSSVTINQVAVSGNGFSLSPVSTPITLAAGQSVGFSVTFNPSATGTATGNLTITSTASNSSLVVSLSATGVTTVGQLGASPSTLPVGGVVVGSSGTASGHLNATGASVTVTGASSNNSAFTISGLPFPATIPAGQSLPFTVTFSPQTTGAASATLTFTSNAQPSSTTETTTGTGNAASSHSVSLSWTASTSSNVSGYNIYRAAYNSSCGSFAKINSLLNTSTVYTDSTVANGATYCYATTAVNSSSEESTYSNIVSNVQVPSP